MAPQAVSPYYYSKIRDLKNQNQLTTGKAFLSPEELAAITGAEIAQRYAANERSRDYQLREQAQKTQTDIAYQNLDLNKDIANANKKAAAISGVGQAITGAVGLYGLGKSLGIWGGGTAAAGAGAAGALSGAGPAVGPTVGGGLAATGEAITPTVIGGQAVGGGLSGLGPAVEGGYELGVGGGAALGGLGAGSAALGTEAATALTSAGGAFEAGMGLSSTGASMAGGAGASAGMGAGAASLGGFLGVAGLGIMGPINIALDLAQGASEQNLGLSASEQISYLPIMMQNYSQDEVFSKARKLADPTGDFYIPTGTDYTSSGPIPNASRYWYNPENPERINQIMTQQYGPDWQAKAKPLWDFEDRDLAIQRQLNAAQYPNQADMWKNYINFLENDPYQGPKKEKLLKDAKLSLAATQTFGGGFF